MSLILHAIQGFPPAGPSDIGQVPASAPRWRKYCGYAKNANVPNGWITGTYWYLLCSSIGFVDSCASHRSLAGAPAPETAAPERGGGFARRGAHIEVAPRDPGTLRRAGRTRTETGPDLSRAISRALSPCDAKNRARRSSSSVSGTAAPMRPRGRYRPRGYCLPRSALSKSRDCGGTLCV